jgi:hypothetical protein
MVGDASTPILPQGLAQDWVQSRDVPCPMCRYNLRMLHTPRCPECGSVFRWQQLLGVCCPRCGVSLSEVDGEHCPHCGLVLNWRALLDSGTALDQRLYEYSDRPVRAALRAYLTALNPWSFWRRLSLEMPPAVSRLRRCQFAALTSVVVGAVLISVVTLAAPGARLGRDALGPLALVLTVPLTTSLALPRFTPTLARFRIRDDHLLRCLAYASSGAFWLGICFSGGFALGWAARSPWAARFLGLGTPLAFLPDYTLSELGTYRLALLRYGDPWLASFNLLLMGAWAFFGLLWWWSFLYVALRRYLRLDPRNALALFLSTQAIALLLLIILLLQLRVVTMALGKLQLGLAAWLHPLQGR